MHRFQPGTPKGGGAEWLEAVVMADPTDGKLVHLDGLNLSHAWMLEEIAAGLPTDDVHQPDLIVSAAAQWASGLASVAWGTSIRSTVTEIEK